MYLRLVMPTVRNISMESAKLVPKDIILIFNSTASQSHLSVRPMMLTVENALLATEVIN